MIILTGTKEETNLPEVFAERMSRISFIPDKLFNFLKELQDIEEMRKDCKEMRE